MSPKLVYFLAYFYMFIIHFNVELWNIHKICVLHVLNAKESNPTRKEEKNWLRQKCCDISSECRDIISR